jgi:hypothetical protein
MNVNPRKLLLLKRILGKYRKIEIPRAKRNYLNTEPVPGTGEYTGT